MWQWIQTQNDTYINSDIQVWRGYVEIGVECYRQFETPETGIDNIRCKRYWRNFCCEVTCPENWWPFFYTQLPLNEDDNDSKEQLSYMNYKKTLRTLHDTGWKNSYHTSADVSMLGYGCGVSQYP